MHTFSSSVGNNLNQVILSLLDRPNSLHYFKLLWSLNLEQKVSSDLFIDNFMPTAHKSNERKYNSNGNIKEPFKQPIINIMCHKNQSINDFICNGYNSVYGASIIKYVTLYNSSGLSKILYGKDEEKGGCPENLTNFINNLSKISIGSINKLMNISDSLFLDITMEKSGYKTRNLLNNSSFGEWNFMTQLLCTDCSSNDEAQSMMQTVLNLPNMSDKQRTKLWNCDQTLYKMVLSLHFGSYTGTADPLTITNLCKYFENDTKQLNNILTANVMKFLIEAHHFTSLNTIKYIFNESTLSSKKLWNFFVAPNGIKLCKLV